jgi:hypothetical protein
VGQHLALLVAAEQQAEKAGDHGRLRYAMDSHAASLPIAGMAVTPSKPPKNPPPKQTGCMVVLLAMVVMLPVIILPLFP